MANSEQFYVDAYSLSSFHVAPMYNEIKISNGATAFLYKRNERAFLISNWHVFSGRNRFSGQPLNTNGAIPNKFVFPVIPSSKYVNENPDSNFLLKTQISISYNLLNEYGEPNWQQHAVHGQEIDIAILEINPQLLLDCRHHFANSCVEKFPNQMGTVGAQAFVVGFPLAISTLGILPIWKGVSIASERFVPDKNGIFRFLIDGLAMEGMSGSPVYLRNTLIGAKTLIEGNDQIFPFTELVGVYSGRLKVSGTDTNTYLGEVWDVSYVDEIIDTGIRGSYVIK